MATAHQVGFHPWYDELVKTYLWYYIGQEIGDQARYTCWSPSLIYEAGAV